VVNPENLFFGQHPAHGFVDGAVGRQVVAQRFFKHHAGLRAVQPGSGDLLDHGGKQTRRGGNVHDHGVGVAGFQQLGQTGVVGSLGDVHAHKMQQGGKARKLIFAWPLGQLNVVKTSFDEGAVSVVTQVVASHADDAATSWQRTVAKSLKQSRHQFAPGQVAGAAKQDKIKTHGLPKVQG
jgi:hypothetical protein